MPQTVRADVDRLTPPAPADTALDEMVPHLRSLGLGLVASQPGDRDVVVSPVSIAVAFAMVEAGAGDETAADILHAFRFPEPPAVHEAMNALTTALAAVSRPGRDGDGAGAITLEVANAVWAQVGLELGAPFLATLAAHYGAGVTTVDYAADPDAARQEINAWVAEVTRDRIPQLLPPGAVTGDTVVALVNAVYLDAAWRTPFERSRTRDRPFTLLDGREVDVPTMHNPALTTVASAADDGTSVVKLPYAGGELAMVVLVPPRDVGLATFEAELTETRLGAMVDRLGRARVDLTLPRWATRSALDLAEPLAALGLRIPGGDLSGMAPGAFIGAAVHAADITVDEERTVAAAATAVMAGRAAMDEPPRLQIAVDRPFLFIVQHEPTRAPLFVGRVTDPR
ncbi:MAG TPA: serpin family protein [Acidimicrobiales bacterium]